MIFLQHNTFPQLDLILISELTFHHLIREALTFVVLCKFIILKLCHVFLSTLVSLYKDYLLLDYRHSSTYFNPLSRLPPAAPKSQLWPQICLRAPLKHFANYKDITFQHQKWCHYCLHNINFLQDDYPIIKNVFSAVAVQKYIHVKFSREIYKWEASVLSKSEFYLKFR